MHCRFSAVHFYLRKEYYSMLKERLKGIIIGLLISAISSATFALAKSGSEWLEAIYSDIKLSINGKNIVSKDVNGNSVDPFIVDGTTYLPVRAVASALDKRVEWDSDTHTVIISDSSKVIADFHHYTDYIPDKYIKVTDSEYASDIVLQAKGNVTDLKIVSISYTEEENMQNTYQLVDVLYEKDILESGDYIITSIDSAGYFPNYAMVYTDDKGDVKAYGLMDANFRGEGLNQLSVEEINLIQ